MHQIYRKLLISRSYQMQSRYSIEDLTEALRTIYGDVATVLDAGHGRVVIAPVRALSDVETHLLQVIPRVLPIAPGIVSRWHFGTFKVFGFGEGWGGFCEDWDPNGDALVTEGGEELVTESDEAIMTGQLTWRRLDV